MRKVFQDLLLDARTKFDLFDSLEFGASPLYQLGDLLETSFPSFRIQNHHHEIVLAVSVVNCETRAGCRRDSSLNPVVALRTVPQHFVCIKPLVSVFRVNARLTLKFLRVNDLAKYRVPHGVDRCGGDVDGRADISVVMHAVRDRVICRSKPNNPGGFIHLVVETLKHLALAQLHGKL